MPLSREIKELQSQGGAGHRPTRDGYGSAWHLETDSNDNADSKDNNPMTPNITGNRLVSVEELTSIGTISSCCSSASGSTTEAEKGQTSRILMRIALSFIGATGRNNRETYHLTNPNTSQMPSLITCLMTTHSVVMSGVLC